MRCRSWGILVLGVFGCAGDEAGVRTKTVTVTVTAEPSPTCAEVPWYPDLDGDGFGLTESVVDACEAPGADYVSEAGDCDDADAGVHPGALDSPLDDIDQDCSDGPADRPDCERARWTDGDVLLEGEGVEQALMDLCLEATHVAGDLVIQGSDAVDLPALSCLCDVAGRLRIADNPALETVSGWPHAVGGDVEVIGNAALTTLDVGAYFVDGSLRLEDNASLDDVAVTDFVLGDVIAVGNGSGGDSHAALWPASFAGSVRVEGNAWDSVSIDVSAVDDVEVLANPNLASLTLERVDVAGSLRVVDNPQLRWLYSDYLGELCLEGVGGSLELIGNPQLDLDAIGCFDTVPGDYVIVDVSHIGSLHPELVDVGGDLALIRASASSSPGEVLTGLQSVGGSVSIVELEMFNGVELLPVLTSVGGDLRLDTVSGTAGWATLDLLDTVGGDLEVRDVACSGCAGIELDGLTAVGGDIEASGDGYLLLPQLQTVGGDITFTATDLTSYAGLELGPGTSVAGDVRFTGCSLSTSRVDLASVGGDLALSGCSYAPDVPFAVTSIGGSLLVEGSGRDFTTLAAFANLTSVGGAVRIRGNHELVDLRGLEALTIVNDDLHIEDNPALATLSGLDGLVEVTRDVRIARNGSLPDLQGLDQLTAVGGGLYVGEPLVGHGNAALQSLDGLQALRTIGYALTIVDNDVLVDVSAIHDLEQVGDWVTIGYNDSLPTSAAQALADEIPIKAGVTLVDNGPG